MRFFLYCTGRKPAQCNASRAIVIFVTIIFLPNAMAPTLVYAATYLQGAQVNANTLVRDAYVAVTYRDSNGEQKLEKGWIDAIDETTFTIRSGGLKSKKTIAYDKVLSVVMSEESTVPAKQMNEVNRFIREMKKTEIQEIGEGETKEAEQAAIQRLKEKLVTTGQFGLSKIDSNAVEIGTFVEVIYGQGERDPVSGEWEKLDTTRGYIQAINTETLTIGERFWKKEIALERIQKLTIADSAPQKKFPFEMGAELLSVQFRPDSSGDPEVFGALAGYSRTMIALGSGLFGRTLPSVYISGLWFSRLALDLGLGFSSASWDEENLNFLGARGGVAYFPKGVTSNSIYVRPFAAVLRLSYRDDWGASTVQQSGAGIGVGYRHIFQNKMAVRLEPSYMRWFQDKQDLIMLHLSFGVILGGESPSPKSE